jgi:hypothetical protein
MAEKRTIDINIKNNADEATKDFNHFNDALDQTAKSAKNVNSTFEEVYGDLQPLTTRLGEAEDRLYELALAGDTTSKEYQALLNKVAEYRKVQIKTDEVVDGAAQTMTQKLGSALNGVTSGFAATQGAMALFGSENEALEKSLLKVQGALAIQQGVQGLTTAYRELTISTTIASAAQSAFAFVTGGATTALKVLRVALISVGIGALVVGIGLLIANFDKLKKAIQPAIQGLKDFGDWIGLTNYAEEERAEARKKRAAAQQKRIAAERKAQEEAYKERLKQIQETSKAEQVAFDRSIRLLESQGKNTIRLRKQRLKQELDEAKQRLELEKRTGGFLVSLYQNLVTERQIAYNDILKEQREFYKQQRDNAKQNEEKRQKEAQEALDSEIDAEIQLLAELDKIRQENEARFRTDEENELNAVAEKYDVLEAMAYGNAEALNEIEIARLNEENEIKAKFATEAYEAQKALDDKAEEDRKAREQKEIADAKAAQQAKIQFANDAFGAIGELANAFAGESEKSQKRAFQINKAVGIAQAIVNTAGAVSAAINPAVGGLGIPAGLPGAALAAATGAAQIATIAKTKFQGGSSGDVSAPSETGLGEAVSPQFNVVGESGVNQLAQLQQQPTQAYVVSGDVTSAQALDRNRVQNATL